MSNAGMKRKRDDSAQVLPRKVRKNSSDDGETPETESAGDAVKPANKHTKKERKKNPSSRIHSLKKLLTRDTLPSDIRQEKERELAALEYDQAKHKSKKQDKRVLEKYHYVRFVERQKAEKRLKQLRKSLRHENEDKKMQIENDIREMEVNRNYAIYAPLHQKYVSVFAKGRDSNDDGGSTEKSSMWYEVETAMQEGQSALEALRDGKRRTPKIGSSDEAQGRGKKPAVKKDKKSVRVTSANLLDDSNVIRIEKANSSEDEMSDGGFFQR